MNRFSRDTNNMDDSLSTHLYEFLQTSMLIIGILILPVVIKHWMIFPLIPFIGLFLIIQGYFVASARELKRLDNTGKILFSSFFFAIFIFEFNLNLERTPIYVHTTNSIEGIRTIRASCKENILCREFESLNDNHSRAFFGFLVTHRWFGFRLDLLCSLYAICTLFGFIHFKG